jgi:hypothetical protein
MSNMNFDRLVKKQNLQDARRALATWEAARKRTDLDADGISFLDRSIIGAREWVKQAEHDAKNWWC